MSDEEAGKMLAEMLGSGADGKDLRTMMLYGDVNEERRRALRRARGEAVPLILPHGAVPSPAEHVEVAVAPPGDE